ncbi:MAG: hypothetical protein E7183_07800 [Erysipelotrichaceae bacterium]|nr:hypothetical protein [Erysipelotrichaceae bacterium]
MVKKLIFILILVLSFCFLSTHVYADENINNYDSPHFSANETVIYKSKTGTLTLSEIKDLVIKYTDFNNIEFGIELLKDTYTGNGTELGEYDITYSLKYLGDNYTQSTIVSLKVKVVKEFAADYYFNGWIYTRNALNKEQLLNTLQKCEVIPNVDLNIIFTSQYFDLTDEEKLNKGVYYGSYSYSSTTGYSAEGVFRINILDGLNSDINYVKPINYGLIIGIIVAVITIAAGVVIAIFMKRKLDYKKQ